MTQLPREPARELGRSAAERRTQRGSRVSGLATPDNPLESAMIRPTTPADTPAILALAVSSGLFPPDATDEVAAVLAGCLAGENGPDHVWLTDDDGGPVGVAYYAPERLTEGTWNLYVLAVTPARQRQGRGAALVRHVERELAARGARLLLIETSGLGSFERTRGFYRALGYGEEARIRDFYKAGDDKVVFRKALG
jgi:ribosomal protein S18 acetylase RimI-like enzyme